MYLKNVFACVSLHNILVFYVYEKCVCCCFFFILIWYFMYMKSVFACVSSNLVFYVYEKCVPWCFFFILFWYFICTKNVSAGVSSSYDFGILCIRKMCLLVFLLNINLVFYVYGKSFLWCFFFILFVLF